MVKIEIQEEMFRLLVAGKEFVIPEELPHRPEISISLGVSLEQVQNMVHQEVQRRKSCT